MSGVARLLISSPDGNMRIASAVTARLDSTAIRSKTYHGYAQIIRLYLKPELGRIVLSKLEPQDVQAMLNHLVERGLSALTVSHVHARLRGALNQAVKWGMVPRNVAALVDPPRVPHTEVTPLDPQQARRLLEGLGRGTTASALCRTACGWTSTK